MNVEHYEKIFLWMTIGVMVIMLVAIGNGVLNRGIAVAGPTGRVMPDTLEEDAPFDEPGVVEEGDGLVVNMVVKRWNFVPGTVEVPVGVPVTFRMSSPDIIHGFKVLRTNLNIMVLPGEISEVTHVFDEPGEYLMVCHEYCGVGHQAMFGTIVVGDAPADGGGS